MAGFLSYTRLSAMLGSKKPGLARPERAQRWGKEQESTHAGRADSPKMPSPAAGFFNRNLSQTRIIRIIICRGQI
jgi:hypothetical protein